MPNSYVCKAAEGTKYRSFLKEECLHHQYLGQNTSSYSFIFPIIRTVLGYSTQVTHKLLLWNMLVLSNISTPQINTCDLGLYSPLVSKVFISLSKSHHFLSASFYLTPSAFQATISNCLPSLQRLHHCWLIILAAFSPQISILHLLIQSLLFQYSFCYFSFYHLLGFLNLLLQYM